MQAENGRIGRRALLERLAQAGQKAITVVTPNRRLAQDLRAGFDRLQAAKGQGAWESADILPFDAWLQRLWDELLYSESAPQLPLLVTTAQEMALWDDVVRASPLAEGLLAPGATAGRARDAWRLAQAWRLMERTRAYAQGDDVRAFLEWSGRFARVCAQRGLLDTARLADELARRMDPFALAGTTLVLYGFDLLAPQAADFVSFVQARGADVVHAGPDERRANARRVSFPLARDEHWAAARWARARLEANPAARIGVVVPDLARSRDAVERVFARVMDPGGALPGAAPAPRVFDVSLGKPLASYPLVTDALSLLTLMHQEVEFEEASRIIRSPFIAGAEREGSRRARLDARLRERCGSRIDLASLVRLVGSADASAAPLLAEHLTRFSAGARDIAHATQRASAWSSAWARALRDVGFPGERALDSAEYQALQKWHELLAAFGTLERVSGRMRYGEALARLSHLARETVFQPESGDAPITIVGVLESAGLAFDHLWIMGLTDDAWPLPARPDPFIPVRLQREAGVPEADAGASLALDRRITQGWLGAAAEVVVSHARLRDDAALCVSPLVGALEACDAAELGVPAFPTLAQVIHDVRDCERVPDGVAPPVTLAHHPGGTSLFQNQAACPFRAFARNRLASKTPGTPQPGLDAAARGTLLHQVLATFWDATRTRTALEGLAPHELRQRLEDAADAAIAKLRKRRPHVLQGRFAQLERGRLVALARQWLEFELRRDEFEVVATEAPITVSFGGITVAAKLDRLDRLEDGAHAVLDYKTGAAALSSWLGPRPDEPQMPMYALSVPQRVEAIAFARVRPGELEFCGLAKAGGMLPGVNTVNKNRSRQARQYADWEALREGWARELEALGHGFAAGDARVDPKRGAATCRYCDQQLFCRVAEKKPQVEAGIIGEEAEDE